MKKILSLFTLLLAATNLFSQTSKGDMPCIVSQNGRHALLVDGKPFFMLGGQSHNSSAWPTTMPGVWMTIEAMNAHEGHNIAQRLAENGVAALMMGLVRGSRRAALVTKPGLIYV
jgi:hypothetical protein